MISHILGTCTTKRRYASKAEALAHRGGSWQPHGDRPATPYHCQFCNGWHWLSGKRRRHR